MIQPWQMIFELCQIPTVKGGTHESIDVSNYINGVYQISFIVENRTWTTMFVKQ